MKHPELRNYTAHVDEIKKHSRVVRYEAYVDLGIAKIVLHEREVSIYGEGDHLYKEKCAREEIQRYAERHNSGELYDGYQHETAHRIQ